MSRFYFCFLLVFLAGSQLCLAWEDGDLIFHQSKSRQSKVIQEVTGSKYTHMGVIVHRDSTPYVLEAIQPVSLTPLEQFLSRGVGRHYVVKRVKKGINDSEMRALQTIGANWVGRNYDSLFAWDDGDIYCSELVWKMFYRGAGIRLGEPIPFGRLDLNSQGAQALILERRGTVDENELVITPAAIFHSPLLYTVGLFP